MKTIWITGGSSGIGKATAKTFLDNNWRVIISSSNNIKLENAKKNISKMSSNKEIYAIKCDITNKDNVKRTINTIENEISPIDLALLNAAAYSPNKSQEFEIENYELLVKVNLMGTLYCINELKKNMGKRDSSHIAIVSSPIGYRGWPTAGAYGMTKAAQINLAESLYFDLKKSKIKISIINPGFIDTESTRLNSFKMPFLKSSEYAAKKIFIGLTKKYKFEIFFPFFIISLIKFARILPYKLYFFIWKKIGGF